MAESEAQILQRAVALHRAGSLAEAEALYRSLLEARRDHLEARYNLGLVLSKLDRPSEALTAFDAVLALRPDFARAHCDRGAALSALSRHEDALASFERALHLDPRNVAAQFNRAGALLALGRAGEALASCDAVLAIAPDLAAAWNNRGSALVGLGRREEAIGAFDRAIALEPDFARARYNRGGALADLGRHEEASRDFARALAVDPALPFGEALLLHSRMHCGDWQSFDELSGRLIQGVRDGRAVADPLTLIGISDSAPLQLACARAWMGASLRAPVAPWRPGERRAPERIRLAYLSADMREHAVAYLAAELFERHDRLRFETFGVSFGPDAPSPMRTRLTRAFDHFLDVRQESDTEVAQRLRALGIDIAVDLTGITARSRIGILAQRPAPVQVNFLGYPGTMGAPHIDYLIADPYVIPPAQQPHYAERVAYLPDCFQPNDATRALAPPPSRATLGLPERAFVFCSFNNSYKITPAMFEVWMRLLRGVPGSVLWLVAAAPVVEANLRREAASRGVDAQRLVFAPRVPYAQHLARCAAADLFLDTLPFNAGTTASDALWAGLPVLTCSGEAFSARMAGSLLASAGLAELVTTSLEDYEARALELAREPARLASLRTRLAGNRSRAPLFDSRRYCRHLEAAYVAMHERARRGEPPATFAVAPLPA